MITISKNPIVKHLPKKDCPGFGLAHIYSPEEFNKRLQGAIDFLKEKGFDIIVLNFDTYNEGDDYVPWLKVLGKRMETPEETAERVARQTASNEREVEEHNKKVAANERRREMERILGGKTIEELRAL